MGQLEEALAQQHMLFESGANLQYTRGNDGRVALGVNVPEPTGFYTDADAPTMQEIGATGSPGKVAGAGAASLAGMAAGAGAGLLGLIPDLMQMGAGPASQEAADAFQESYGTEAMQERWAGFVDTLDIPEQFKFLAKDAALIGEYTGLPGAAAVAKPAMQAVPKMAGAVGEAVSDYAAGAPGRIADRTSGTVLGAGVDPTAIVDEAIVAGQKLMGKDPVPAPSALGLLPASDAPTVSGLAPEYRVTVDGFTPEGTGKQSLVPIKLTPQNAEKTKPVMEQLAQEFPDPLASPDTYANMMAKMQNKAEVSKPPSWMIEHANDTDKWADWFGQITPDQIKAADEGLAVQGKFKAAYSSGAGPELTGQLMLWTILSRMLSAFPHEAGYLELAEAATPFIQKAAKGDWSDADSAAWREMAMTIQPEGAPGKSATSNANAFGETFLKKMSAVDENGVSALERLHNMIADPNMTSAQIRREYYSLAEGTGIANKILSFALLVSGRNDVVVLDRIQINQMWGGGEKIYDDIMKQFEGAQGLVQYEALERSLLNRVPILYDKVGRGGVGSVGRYHWESWVRSSGQIVAHPTLEAVVGMGAKRPGANLSPTDFVPVTEGRFHTRFSGVSYEKLPGGGARFLYNTSDGKPYQFTKEQLDGMFKEAFKKSSGVLPPDFPGVKAFEGGNIPWYEYEGVNRGKLDQLIRKAGTPKVRD